MDCLCTGTGFEAVDIGLSGVFGDLGFGESSFYIDCEAGAGSATVALYAELWAASSDLGAS